MSTTTKIEWTDATWPALVTGCTKCSPACDNCYAEIMHNRLRAMGHAAYQHPFSEVRTHPESLEVPLHWRKPRRIFVNSMSDLFHDDVPFDFIDQVFAATYLVPSHTYQILTKRLPRMAEYLSPENPNYSCHRMAQAAGVGGLNPRIFDPDVYWPLPNVLLGVTVWDQLSADAARPHMATLAAQGWRMFVSSEPRLGPIAWTGWEFLSQLIVGGETGPHARPMHPDWLRADRDWAAAAGVPFFFKGWGEYLPNEQASYSLARLTSNDHLIGGSAEFPGDIDRWKLGKARSGHRLDGREHREGLKD